jgi:DNA polymerase-3 subunit delta'
MPFTPDWIVEKIGQSKRDGRLAHAYLLTASRIEPLEELLSRLVPLFLGSSAPNHPDLHVIRPESKSRRLTIEQIRTLEHVLQLKAYQAPLKVAAIVAADRMCLGAAEPANAFLKTLEEPPDNTVIFLLTQNPEQLLPTIRSRCLLLPVEDGIVPEPTVDPVWLTRWIGLKGDPADTAYTRAAQLAELWAGIRSQIEDNHSAKGSKDDDSKELIQAQIESDFLFARDRSLSELTMSVWQTRGDVLSAEKAVEACEALEDLRYSLSRNIESGLALERCCLRISGLI